MSLMPNARPLARHAGFAGAALAVAWALLPSRHVGSDPAPAVRPATIASAPSEPAPPAPPKARAAAAAALDRSHERFEIRVPAAAIAAEIARLEGRVNAGDATSAYPLFALLEHCARAPYVAEMFRKTRAETPPGMAPAVADDVMAEASLLESACAAVPAALLARRLELLDLAATRGDLRARVDFASYPPEWFGTPQGLIRNADKLVEYKAKAMAFLHSAAEQGSPIALLKLAGLYREGTLVERDNVVALAYYLAWDEVGGTDGGVDPWRQQREWGMSAAQLGEAREMQRAIVARCCRAGR